jgi:hypothetical protein
MPVGGNSRIVFNKHACLTQSSEAFPSSVVNRAAARHFSMAGMISVTKGLLASDAIRPTAGADGRFRGQELPLGKKDWVHRSI